MNTLTFKGSEVLPIMKHAVESEEWVELFGMKPPDKPIILLVHDHGVYLMSGGKPGQRDPNEKDKLLVAYALECDPNKHEDWWQRSRDIVGGDDFGEPIEVSDELLEAMGDGENTRVIFDVHPTRFTIHVVEMTAT